MKAGHPSCRQRQQLDMGDVDLPRRVVLAVRLFGRPVPWLSLSAMWGPCAGAGPPSMRPPANNPSRRGRRRGQEESEVRGILVDFFGATNGQTWLNRTNWNTSAPVEEWHGMSPRDTADGERRWSMELSFNNLRGTLPDSFFEFASLERLDVSFNDGFEFGNEGLTGSLPSGISGLSNIEHIDLGRCSFTGPLPTEIGLLQQLHHVDLSFNGFGGKIPMELGQLKQLRYLHLGTCNFTGSLPSELGLLTLLNSTLDVKGNGLTGTLATELGQLHELQWLEADANALSGELPTHLGNMSSLTNLHLSNNKFGGPLPSEVGRLRKLEWLYLERNELSGRLPSEIGLLHNLENLDLDFNPLITGTLPDQIGSLSNLLWLEISGCSFSGQLPATINSLTLLSKLSARDNRFSGTLIDFENFRGNETGAELDLRNNSISGTISSNFFLNVNETQFSSIVRLGRNDINGTIPDELSRIERLTIELDDNRITGIADVLCNMSQWNSGNVGAHGCDGILCAPGTYNYLGRATDFAPCEPCDGQPTPHFGGTACPQTSSGVQAIASSASRMAASIPLQGCLIALSWSFFGWSCFR